MSERLPGPNMRDESIGTLLSRAFADAEHVARSEIALQKARLTATVTEARSATIFLVCAFIVVCMALTALVVGALLILQRAVGPVWATVIVLGTLVVIAAVLGWLGAARLKIAFGAKDRS